MKLKTLRVALALIFLIACTLLLGDLWHIVPATVVTVFFSLQFIPSLTKSLTPGWISLAGVIAVIGLTVLFGRVYCSTICPLGTLQDMIIHAERKINRRRKASYRPPFLKLQYTFLGTSILCFALGSAGFLELIEPYSSFGRIIVTLLVPPAVWISNGISMLLGRLGYYGFYQIPYLTFNVWSLLLSAGTILIIGHLAYRHGRLFCNSVCPAGAIIGTISRHSLYRFRIDRSACNECGKCERICKANCIDASRKKVDPGACVACFNCLDLCPTDAVHYRPLTSEMNGTRAVRFDPSRRNFFRQLSPPLIGLSLPFIAGTGDSTAAAPSYDDNRKNPIAPPGSESVEHFTGYCTACYLCVSACPSHVLAPSFLEYGIGGMFQPKMDYAAGYCGYDCVVCGEVCPGGAIRQVDLAAKKLIQIGKAVFVKDDCVVVAKKKDCAACSEHCPTKAIRTIAYEGSLLLPELHSDFCIGCGACEHACPTAPRKAIYVTPKAVHTVAKKPEIQKQEQPAGGIKEFPF